MTPAEPRRGRVAVLISGGGTNLQALIDACADGSLHAEIVAVIANRKAAYGLSRAEKAGIATTVVSLKAARRRGESRAEFDADVADRVAAFRPDLIVLAGWMHVLSTAFLSRFAGRVINLHPALPGCFAGTHAIERTFTAWERGEVARGGVMVHHVIAEVDAGAPVAVQNVPLHAGDTLDTFAARIHAAEHKIIVRAVRQALASATLAPVHEGSTK